MEILDIGGGLPADTIHQEIIDALKSTYNDPLGYKIIAEPGRYLSSKSC
jgi:diaminopimelate decarboxylase